MSDVEMEDVPQQNTFQYDLDQDPDEKRAVRKDYRSLAKKIEDREASELSADLITNQIEKANELFGRVKAPQEATLDSAFLLAASNLGAQKARALKSGSGAFDIDDFVSKLFTFMGGAQLEEQFVDESDAEPSVDNEEPLEWHKIGRKVLAKSHRVPMLDFMLGPLSVEQKKRPTGKRAKLEKNKEDMKRPQEIKEGDIARSENETSKNVQTLQRLLQGAGQVNLFKFIINPNDFAQTVENLFHLSFLIRDGQVALDIDNAEPIIYACEQPTDEDRDDGLKKQQQVFEFDMATWRQAIEIFDIKESMIPQRPPAKTRLGDKWYG